MTYEPDSQYKPSQAYWDKRNESIERQVACKCVAQVYTGRSAPEEEIVKAFNLFIKLIRGK